MELTFKEDTHEYFLGDKKLISVTQLMSKQGLAPNYSNVADSVLTAKAERGTLIHAEIEEFNKNGSVGFTNELVNFMNYINQNKLKVEKSEFKVNNDIVAGTVDLLIAENGETVVADIKTTSTLHNDSVSWQLSIYNYLGNLGATKGQAFHFNKDGELNVVDIPLKPVEEVEKLLECERNGETYKQELAVSDNQLMQLIEVETLIKTIEEQKKQAEQQAVELRAALLEAMENNGVKTFENERIRITYTAPTTRQAVDSTKLKKEQPAIYEQYLKTSDVKARLTITIKESSNE